MIRFLIILLFPILGYAQVQTINSIADRAGNRSQRYQAPAPPAEGTAPTSQTTYVAEHEPTTALWNQTTYDYVVSATGNSMAAGTLGDPFDLQEFLDGTVSITQNTGDPTVVVLRGGTYIYPTRGDGEDGYVLQIDGQTPPATWDTETAYSVGDQVREKDYSPHFWECTTGHMSGVGTLQTDVANWTYAHVPDHYVLIRNYNQEEVYIDGGLYADGLNVSDGPEHIMLWGFNFYNQEFVDDWDSDGNDDTSVNGDGDRFLAFEGNSSFPSNIPHDGGVSFTYGRELRMINAAAWAIGFGHGGTQAEGQWWHGNTVYDQGWVTTERYHGPAFYQRNGELTNSISGTPKEVWIDTNMMIENYSQQLQIYGTGGVPLEMFVVQRNFAEKHPNSGRENFLGGGSRNFPQWTYPVYWEENVTLDCDQTVGPNVGGKWLELYDNWVFSKPGGINRKFDIGGKDIEAATAYSPTYNYGGNTDDPAAGIYVFLAENSFEYGRANLLILQTATPTVDTVLVDMDDVFVSGDEWAIYDMQVHDPFAQTPVQTGTHSEGTSVGVSTGNDVESFYVIRATTLN